MKLLENLIYSSILFLALYVVISIALRMFELTTIFNSHLIGGVVATIAAVVLFLYLLIKKGNSK